MFACCVLKKLQNALLKKLLEFIFLGISGF
jgi:hypothetical protein